MRPAAVLSVLRGEGAMSATRRASERAGETIREAILRVRALGGPAGQARILNVSPIAISGRHGGLAIQLNARLEIEAAHRAVCVLSPGLLRWQGPASGARRVLPYGAGSGVADDSFETLMHSAISETGARAIHVEGMAGLPVTTVRRLAGEGVRLIVTAHDFALFCARPNLIEEPTGVFCSYSADYDRCSRCLASSAATSGIDQRARREAARELLVCADRVIYPSEFLRRKHEELFGTSGRSLIIEPGVASRPSPVTAVPDRRRVAFVGSVVHHKGGALLEKIVEMSGGQGIEWQVFGGGEESILSRLRRHPRVAIHGYYRAERLPGLLQRHRVALAVLPSICPESFGLTLSECWSAGIPAIVFGHGAQAERIEHQGGGWVVPLEAGAGGISAMLARWLDGSIATPIPHPAGAVEAADRHLALYRELGIS